MNRLTKLLILIENNIDFSFHGIDIDKSLDERDEESFDSEWVLLYTETQNINLTNDELEKIEKIREKSFFSCYKKTEIGELSSYVSDDFELIARSIASNNKSYWISTILYYYLNGQFPSGDIKLINLSICDLIDSLI